MGGCGAIIFLFLPTLLLPRPNGIFYLAGFMIGMSYRRPRFNRQMEAIGIAPQRTTRAARQRGRGKALAGTHGRT